MEKMHNRGMAFARLILFALLLAGAATPAAAQSFDEKVTSASNVRLNVTNVGTFGNAFRGYRDGSGLPSCEYPAGSGTEHLFESGIWIGGKENGGPVRVSTSAYDAPQGYAPGRGGFEFTAPVGSYLQERSSLTDNPNYAVDAVSHQDFVAQFTDANLLVPGTNIPISSHLNPMNVEVRMETYNWNYRFSDFFVLVNLVFKNVGTSTYEDTYISLWNNSVVRNINVTPAGAGGAVFYSQGGNGFIDSLSMNYRFDASGDPGFTDSYIGQKFLGAEDKNGFQHPSLNPNFKANYNAWVFNNSGQSLYFFPTTENQRYTKMSQGLNQDPCWTDPSGVPCQSGSGVNIQAQLNQAGNRSDLLSVGPFASFAPGDEVRVAFAYVLGAKKDDGLPNAANTAEQKSIFLSNASWAQTAFNGEDVNFNGLLDAGEDKDGDGKITRFILPTPPATPKIRVEPGNHKIDVYWADNAERSVDPISQKLDFEGYRIYLSKLGFDVTATQNLAKDFVRVAQMDVAGNGLFFDTGLEQYRLAQPKQFPGDTVRYRYRYTVDNLPNGWQHAVAVTSFDQGNPATGLESLESSFLANDRRAFAGTPANDSLKNGAPYVYPNPYYAGASWEGRSNFQEESRKLIFANLPARCKITITTVAGDVLDIIDHNENYNGSDIRWFRTFGSDTPDDHTFSGGEHAWDLLTRSTQMISRGIYLFHVEDLETGKKTTGQFTVVQ
jgi:hypothetical protein